jgi:O-antigen ligase
MRKNLLLLIPIFWLIGWISLPGVSAIQSASDIAGQPHKIIAKILISLITIAGLFLGKRATVSNFFNQAQLFWLFIIVNIAILPLSYNFFYSSSRLFEFALMTASCFLLMYDNRDEADMKSAINKIFIIMTLFIIIALALFHYNPAWGAKNSGFNATTGTYMYRLGGSFLRVDLMATLAGACLMYWIYHSDRKGVKCTIINSVGICVSVAALGLAHSRSALILATCINTLFYLWYEKKCNIKTVILILVLSVGIASYFYEIIEFYTRGESFNRLQTGSGRTYLYGALFKANEYVNFILGNGYLMNSPDGLYYYVKEMAGDMASPHNGYLSVLLGSGLVGLYLCILIHVKLYKNLMHIRHSKYWDQYKWIYPTFLFLTLITFFDYGIWGVTSPGLLLFTILYFSSSNISRQIRRKKGYPRFYSPVIK